MSLPPHHRPIPSATATRAYCAGLVDLDTAVTASIEPSPGRALATTIFATLLVLWYVLSPPPPPGSIAPPLWLAIVVYGVWVGITVKRWRDYLCDRADYRAAVATVNDALARDAAEQLAAARRPPPPSMHPAPADG